MNSSKNPFLIFLGALLAMALLAALSWGGWLSALYIWAQFQSLDRTTASLMVLSAVCVAACALLIARSIRVSVARLERGGQSEKRTAYGEFVSLWFPHAAAGKPLAEWPEDWMRLQPRLALWAGDAVLKQYHNLLRQAKAAAPSDPKARHLAERVVLEMRKELGCMNSNWSVVAWREMLGQA